MRLFLISLFFLISPAAYSSFSLDSAETLLYAKEALTSAELKGSGRLFVTSLDDSLNLTFKAGFGISPKRKYIRLELENGVFNNQFPATGLATNVNYSTTLIAGGAVGDDYILVEVSANPTIAPDTEFTLESDSFILLDSNKSLGVQYTLYESASAALYDTSFIYRTSSVIAKVISAIGRNATRSFEHSVGFKQDFLRFNSTYRSPNVFELGDASPELASVGKVLLERLMVDDVRLASTSEVINSFADLFPLTNTAEASTIITGDFSTVRAFLSEQDDCGGAFLPLAEYSDIQRVPVSIDNLISFPVLCLSAESESITLVRSTYTLDMGLGIGTSLLGGLVYDAASIDLPYITNFEDYRQRILLVNHTGYDVAYTTRFVSEESVDDNYTVGYAASGIIPANSTLKLNSEDVVNIASGSPTRISARILIDARPSDISAAVQILSITSGMPPQTNVLQVLEN